MKMTAKERVATNIRTIARARNLKLRTLSAELGFKNEQNLYNRLNSGNFSADELATIADILEVRPGDLFEEEFPFGQTGRRFDQDVRSALCETDLAA